MHSRASADSNEVVSVIWEELTRLLRSISPHLDSNFTKHLFGSTLSYGLKVQYGGEMVAIFVISTDSLKFWEQGTHGRILNDEMFEWKLSDPEMFTAMDSVVRRVITDKVQSFHSDDYINGSFG